MKASILRHLTALTACFLIGSCVPSLQPLSTKETAVFDEALLGTWTDAGNSWAFTRDGDKAYELIYTDDHGETGRFTASLVKLDGKLFLDLFPRNPDSKGASFWKFHFVRAHTFLLVDEIGEALTMRVMNPDWLKNYAKENPGAIATSMVEDRIVLTASTEELQKFLPKVAALPLPAEENKAPFGKAMVLKKK